MNSTNDKTNILPEFKKPNIFYPFIALIIFLIILLFCLLLKVTNPFNSKLNKSQEEIVADIFIVLFFSLLVFGICVILLPNFKDVKKLFEQISSVTYVIIYTIFLILSLTLIKEETINSYSYILVPILTILGALAFYISSTSDYSGNFNVNYERIKTMILLFCLITIFIIYYNIDPGGYIHKYFGYSLLLTIITTVFTFLYLIILLTLPDTNKPDNEKPYGNFLENFTKFSSYGSLSFLLFIIIVTIIISTYPGGFFNDKINSSACMIVLLQICILWAILLGAVQFPEVSNNSITNSKISLFKRSLLALFGVIISSLIIFWIVYNIQNLSGNSSILSLILNLLIVIIVLGLIYKTINVKTPVGNYKKNAFFSLIFNTIFYIPCLFSTTFDLFGKFIVGEYNSTTAGSLIMLIVAIILLISYFLVPSVFNKINLQGGQQLVNNPVYTDSQYSLGSYEQLNGSETFDYQYGISFWVFIDAAPPNTNPSYSKYTSLLNFGDKPNVLYNGKTNTLMIITQQKDLNKVTENKLTDFDDNGNRIIYKNENVLLQKWNNFIINYNGGVLDIFLNGELVKSVVGVVPYYKLENLTIGEDNGIKGGICNVVYFRKPLSASNIYYLYNMVKNRTPPILNDSNETIVKNSYNTSV
jgi:hypothetical protein